MQSGFSRFEGLLIFFTFNALFLLGTYAVSRYSITVAMVSLGVMLFLWYYVHRIRLCNFCDQKCPYRPRLRNERLTKAGFTTIEAIVFYTLSMLIMGAYVAATFALSIVAGVAISALASYALYLYRTKICPNCKTPCPFNKNVKQTAA